MKTRYRVESSVFADYESVIVDLDNTIWQCLDARGTSIPAFKMEPPFRLLEEDLVADQRENVCRLQPTVRDVLDCLDEHGMNLGVVSRSAVEDVSDEAQPARMLLAKLDLLKYFTYIVVIKAGIQKADYVRPEGRTLFIDDQDDQLQDVNARGLADVLSRRKFVNWADLFQESRPERPGPTTVQYFKNAPQPTTSALRPLKFAAPETYTDKSDIDEGIGGSSRSRAEMWGVNDHQEIENGRDHVWGEPWEPMDQYFLNETDVTPTVNDKLRVQHPDKGGLTISNLSFADVLHTTGVRTPGSTWQPSGVELSFLIDDLSFMYVQKYAKRKDLFSQKAEDQVITMVRNALETQYRLSPQLLYDVEHMIEDSVMDAFDRVRYANSSGWSGGDPWDTPQGYSPHQQVFSPPPASGDFKDLGFSKNNSYWPSPDELRTEVRTFLLTKFMHEQFSISDMVKIIDAYVPLARQFGPADVKTVVQELPTKYPTEFSLDGKLIMIGGGSPAGVPETGVPTKTPQIPQTTPGPPAPLPAVPRIDIDRLKAVTEAKIEDFAQYGQTVQTEDGMYVFKDNGADILGVAHLDTRQDMQHFRVTEKDRTRVIHNAQLDDRLGAYVLLDMLPAMGVHADVLLTEGEEVGRSTAKYFKPTKQYKWIFSFDRKGMDTVMYGYHDPQTEKLMNDNQFTVGRGSVSDISYLEHLGAKGFNFGAGYYDYHTKNAHVVESHLMHNVQLFKKFYDKYKTTALPHVSRIPKKPGKPGKSGKFSSSLADQQLRAQVEEVRTKLGTTDVREIQQALCTYYGVSEMDARRATLIAQADAIHSPGVKSLDFGFPRGSRVYMKSNDLYGDPGWGIVWSDPSPDSAGKPRIRVKFDSNHIGYPYIEDLLPARKMFNVGDRIRVDETADSPELTGEIHRVPTETESFFWVNDLEGDQWLVDPKYIHKTAAVELPKAEQYTDYIGTMDVSPKDPKGQDELEAPGSTRKELERRYFETDLHNDLSFARDETARPLTPYASLSLSHGEPPPANTAIHRPNTLLVHEGVLQALTFGEIEKHWSIVRHEARDDYEYSAQMAVDHS